MEMSQSPPASSRANTQPPSSTTAPDESATSEILVPIATETDLISFPEEPVAPAQPLPSADNATVLSLPASFDVNAYSPAAWAYARYQSVNKDKGGLILPDTISIDSELWVHAKRAILERVRFRDVGSGRKAGLECILEPQLKEWVGNIAFKHCRNCTNRIYKAANPPGMQPALNAEQILARLGRMPKDGGFDLVVSQRISDSLYHMFKYMMWAFDLVEMQKNKYEHYVPADRYRFMRMLGLVPNGKIPLEFDIVSTGGPNRGQKTGVWIGTLDQLSDQKGDQRLIPNKRQCEALLEEIFGEKEAFHKARALRLGRPAVRECFANQGGNLRQSYETARALSR